MTYVKHLLAACLIFSASGAFADAKPYHMLFIGNSLTYYPNQSDAKDPTPDHPMLPTLIKKVIEAKHPELSVTFESSTPGGWSFEKHYELERSKELLKKNYDIVVLQGLSIGAMQLPQWFLDQGYPSKDKFLKYGELLAGLSPVKHDHVYLYAMWAYHPKHPYFAAGFAGGAHWFGPDWNSITDQIEISYEELAKKLSAHVVPVGTAWRAMHDAKGESVAYDDLFWDLKVDFLHPSYKGTYFNSLIFFRRIFKESVLGAPFDSKRITKAEAEYLQKFVDEHVPLL